MKGKLEENRKTYFCNERGDWDAVEKHIEDADLLDFEMYTGEVLHKYKELPLSEPILV